MSKYNHYAKELAEAFRAAQAVSDNRRAKMADHDATIRAADGFHKYKTDTEESRAKARRARAAAELEELNIEAKDTDEWRLFFKRVDELTSSLNAEYEADNLIDPEAVDNNAITLLNSGIAKPADLINLRNKYDGNKTMQRLIGQYAVNRASEERDPLKAQAWMTAAQDVDTVLGDWYSLCNAAAVYSGNKNLRTDSRAAPTTNDYTAAMQRHFSDDIMQQAIDNF